MPLPGICRLSTADRVPQKALLPWMDKVVDRPVADSRASLTAVASRSCPQQADTCVRQGRATRSAGGPARDPRSDRGYPRCRPTVE
jgi:hypothetical protein